MPATERTSSGRIGDDACTSPSRRSPKLDTPLKLRHGGTLDARSLELDS